MKDQVKALKAAINASKLESKTIIDAGRTRGRRNSGTLVTFENGKNKMLYDYELVKRCDEYVKAMHKRIKSCEKIKKIVAQLQDSL